MRMGSSACPGCARGRGPLAGALRAGAITALGEKLGRQGFLAAFRPASTSGSSCSAPYWRHDRSRNRWARPCSPERLGAIAVATGNAHAHARLRAPTPQGDALGRNRAERNAGGERAAPARQLDLGAHLPRSDGRRALRRASRGRSPKTVRPRRAPRLRTSPPGSATRYPGFRRRGRADGELGPRLRPPPGRALRRRPAPARSRAPARVRSLATIRGAQPLRLLPPPPRHARAGARGGRRSRSAARPRPASVLPPGRGRGSSVSLDSSANLTGLSHVDPVKAELFSGRFLNDETSAMPDIDLDFPRDIREVLIPAPSTSATAMSTRRWLPPSPPTGRRARCATSAKALGLPPEEIDKGGEDGRLPRVGDRGRARTWWRRSAPKRAAEPRWAPVPARNWRRRSWACPANASQHPGGDGDLDPAA